MSIQPWMRGILMLGGGFNLLWAIVLYYFGDSYLIWITEGSQQENSFIFYLSLWFAIQGLLLVWTIVNPAKYSWAILTVFIAKLLGGILVLFLIMESEITKKYFFHVFINNLVWLIPLAIILKAIYSKKH